jgi:hypothetical protein
MFSGGQLESCEELGEAALGFPAWLEPRWLDVGRRRIRGAHRKDWAVDFSDVGRRATIMLQSRAQACTRHFAPGVNVEGMHPSIFLANKAMFIDATRAIKFT